VALFRIECRSFDAEVPTGLSPTASPPASGVHIDSLIERFGCGA
jgi:hypothetical protein